MDELGQYVERFDQAVSSLMRTLWPELVDFKEFGLTAPQFSTLRVLNAFGPCKMTDLADKFEVKPSAITVMVDRLVAGGFVERRPSEHDRRIVNVAITESGKRMIAKAQEKGKNVLYKYFALLEREDVAKMVEVNEKLAAIVLQMKDNSNLK